MNLAFPFLYLCLFSLALSTQARTFVAPHVFETKGRTSTESYAIDTEFVVTFLPSESSSSSATLELYLFDQATGLPMRGASGTVCAPCAYELDSDHPWQRISLESLIETTGGGFDRNVKLGFALISVLGEGADAVNVQGFVVNSHSGAFDLSVFPFNPEEVRAAADRTYGFTQFTQTTDISFTDRFDTSIIAAYAGGLVDLPDPGEAQVDLFLFDQATGAPLQDNEGASICAPCTIELNASSRKAFFNLRELIPPGEAAVQLGYGILQVTGPGADYVSLQGHIVNTRTSAFDFEISDLGLQEITSPASSFSVLPHLIETSSPTTTPYSIDSRFSALYVGGLAGLPAADSEVNLDLYLYENSTGLPLQAAAGDVCNLCTFVLNERSRGISQSIEQLINNAGGFDRPVKIAFGILNASGDVGNLLLQGRVINSHASALDLSVFGFEPQHLQAATARSFIFPRLLETSERITTGQYSFDTTIFAVYGGQKAGVPAEPPASATLDLRLFDAQTGAPLQGQAGVVCDPCTFTLSPSQPKTIISVQELIEAAGGFSSSVVLPYAVVTLSGDYANVALQAFVINARTSPFDLSIFGYEPQPLLAYEPPSSLPILSQPRVAADTFSFSFLTQPSQTYQVEATATLSSPIWIPLGEPISGTGALHTFTHPIETPARFFRLVLLSLPQ